MVKYTRKPQAKRVYKKKSSAKYSEASLVKLIKKVSLKQSETKMKDSQFSKVELYHNTYTDLGNPLVLSYPSQGSADDQRIGDSIVQRGMKVRMLFGQKFDRPNVTFKIWLFRAPINFGFSAASFFDITTGNILLDSTNSDRVKVVYHKTLKKNFPNTHAAAGVPESNEITFPHSFYIKFPKKITFTSDNGVDPGMTDHDYYLIVSAYDAYGSLTGLDNIGYVQSFFRYYYKDP